MRKQVVVIGAGPAGLTAAHKLVDQQEFDVIILEKSKDIGGISKTLQYRGNRIDIGGHRFFSKSDAVMAYWKSLLPIQGKPARDDKFLHRERKLSPLPGAPDPEKEDRCLLVRTRISRIFFLKKFFDYPVSLSWRTFANLGIARSVHLGLGYVWSMLAPRKREQTLEDFMVNRFGKPLYRLFFKHYTEKVWGKSCKEIAADWGRQRIKGLSIKKALLHAVKSKLKPDASVAQKHTESSLIDRFLYPKYGPGQLWETDAQYCTEKGASLLMEHTVVAIRKDGDQLTSVIVRDNTKGQEKEIPADYVISSMPIKDLIQCIRGDVPKNVAEVAGNLEYRDFITVGVLLKKLRLQNNTKIKTVNNIVPDNWIYIQERDVLVGRLQIFNNWSPYLVHDSACVWIGMEYFCNQGDRLWSLPDEDMKRLAVDELASIGVADKDDLMDSCVIRVEKAYPAYFGAYSRFSEVRSFLDAIPNLYPVGRNGMHRYNNMDHSMLSAMEAVNCITSGSVDKKSIWSVNTEQEYHEERNSKHGATAGFRSKH
ncbi:MAG: NAD(P)/FAD-dependent oxidoreductase [Desulfomicrobium sp.]